MSVEKRIIRKIALVEPKTSTTTFYSEIRIPRQGAVLLGTILARLGYEVEVQIEEIRPLDWSGIVGADLVGISTITPTAPRSYALADALRRAGVPVVMGGFHVTFLPEEGLDHADFVVRGEGEDTIVELVRALEAGGDLRRIRGLSFHADGEKVHNPDRPLECDLDRYPVPDFSLVRGMKPGGVVTIVTRRGCPFDCSFCCVAPFNGRTPRETSVERVLSEIQQQLPLIGTAGALLLISYLGYERLTEEQLVGVIEFSRSSPEEYTSRLMIDGQIDRLLTLRGDEWQLDARVITWKPPMTVLGFEPVYQLERLSGRYSSAERERTEQRTVHALADERPLDLWSLARKFPRMAPGIDAFYGTATYVPMADGARFRVTLSRDALIARPINDFAREAVGDWGLVID